MGKNNNVFVSFLDELKVKHTKYFSDKHFNGHSNKDNLYGLSKMLGDYNIENQSLRIKDKEKILTELEVPFIAHVNNDFATVCHFDNNSVDYIWRGKKISVSTTEFNKNWSGIILLAEPDESSIEPDYREHRKIEILRDAKYGLLISVCVFILSMTGFYTQFYKELILIPAFLINLFGFYTCFLLYLKQIHVYNSHAEKICSLLVDKSDCNNILESGASKILGVSWSEIGLGYFLRNIAMMIFMPTSYSYVTIINICALPYTIWSIYYQKFKIEQWCPLCLIVMAVLWTLFLYNLCTDLIRLPSFNVIEIFLTVCIYAFPTLLLNILSPILLDAKAKEKVSWELNSMKSNEKIFDVLIKTKPRYEIDKTVSTILLGNIEAENLVTIVGNLHCNPCARIHKKIKQILDGRPKEYCIQYIFTSFGKNLEADNKYVMSIYRNLEQGEFLSFMDEWYRYGRQDRQKIMRKYPYNKDIDVDEEYEKHKEWIKKTKIMATPTVLFNGYELPQEIYKPEDLYLLSDMKLNNEKNTE